MTDRELLELAAKAYWGDEIDDVCSIRWLEEDQAIGYTHGDNQDHNGVDREFVWNPLTDDGDALRLACDLGLRVFPIARTQSGAACSAVGAVTGERLSEVADVSLDTYAATRRAIVRAAAEIGKGMA